MFDRNAGLKHDPEILTFPANSEQAMVFISVLLKLVVYIILLCISAPTLNKLKFGRDRFCREFWKGETNFLSLVRPDPKTDGNFGNLSAGVLFSKVAYQRKRW